jgi:hypothetical protein
VSFMLFAWWDEGGDARDAGATDVNADAGGQAAWPGPFSKLNALPPYGRQRRK